MPRRSTSIRVPVAPEPALLPWIAAIVIGGAAIRFACLFGDLWLDEIRSLDLLSTIHAPAEIFQVLTHDNNHPLNSVFLYELGHVHWEWTYRLLSWATGTATVILAVLLAQRTSQTSQTTRRLPPIDRAGPTLLVTAVLFAFSYVLVLYSSEARGYAPAAAFGLLAFLTLVSASWRWCWLYWLALMLAVLAHPIAVQVLAGGIVWSLGDAVRRRGDRRAALWRALVWQGPAVLGCALYYAFFLSRVVEAGGPQNSLADVLAQVAAYTIGLPLGAGGWIGLAIGAVAVSAGAAAVARRDVVLAIAYVVVIVSGPILALNSSQFVLIFPRYFLMSTVFGLLLTAQAIGTLWTRRVSWRRAIALAMMLFVIGAGLQTSDLIRFGRGQYRAALSWIAAQDPSATITVSSDHDFRNDTVIEHYAALAAPGRRFEYFPMASVPVAGTGWFFVHRLTGETPPASELSDFVGHHYALVKLFRSAPLSGWDWYVYRNQGFGVSK